MFTLQVVTNGSIETEEEILELKAAVWACAHLGTSESGVALLESAQVVEALVRVASFSTVLTLRGTAFFALNLVAMTTAGVDILARFGEIFRQLFFTEYELVYSLSFLFKVGLPSNDIMANYGMS